VDGKALKGHGGREGLGGIQFSFYFWKSKEGEKDVFLEGKSRRESFILPTKETARVA